MKKNIFLIIGITLLQSCYFGIGLVEDNLPGNFMLFANNKYEELVITHSFKDKSTYNIVIDETVFAVGYNNQFIIAKSYSKAKVLYHIIEVKKGLEQKYLNLTFQEYKSAKKQLRVPEQLNFTIIYNEFTKN